MVDRMDKRTVVGAWFGMKLTVMFAVGRWGLSQQSQGSQSAVYQSKMSHFMA